MVNAVDKDGTGNIDFPEFLSLMVMKVQEYLIILQPGHESTGVADKQVPDHLHPFLCKLQEHHTILLFEVYVLFATTRMDPRN
jgi:hypothetical protein